MIEADYSQLREILNYRVMDSRPDSLCINNIKDMWPIIKWDLYDNRTQYPNKEILLEAVQSAAYYIKCEPVKNVKKVNVIK